MTVVEPAPAGPLLARVAELEDRWRREPTGELEIDLVQARRDALAELVGVPRADPVAPGDAPPVGPSGLPELTPAELTSPRVRAAFATHGCVVVRGLVPDAALDGLRSGIDTALEHWEGLEERFDTRSYDPWYDPQPVFGLERQVLARRWVSSSSGLLGFDSPRMLARILDLYDRLGVRRAVADLLGARPVVSANKFTLRRVPVDTNAGWHQDGAFLGEQIRAVNVWATLTDCGVDAPGLDIVPRRFEDIVETGTHGSWFDWAVGDGLIDGFAQDTPVVRPSLHAGDAVIFDEMMLHRTATDPSMAHDRYAIELWSFAGSAYPKDHVALVW